ncbi:MAG: insulinase family protein, partial [Pseudomonas sp.]
MSERKPSRLALIGLVVVAVIGSAAFYLSRSGETNASEALDKAKASQKLQSLTELNGKAPEHRKLDVQTWNTAEGTKVLFVEAHELPMFDMRLIFAAGSSQDGDAPGVAVLTNAMLNEGVAGKDVGAIAQGFEGLGADFGNGAYKDMAIASLRSLSAKDKREPALKLFAE